MAKHKYELTDETYDVMRSHALDIAREYECDESYIYVIKDAKTNDPYPHFRRLFRAAARAGAPAEMLNDLQGIIYAAQDQRTNNHKILNVLLDKMQKDHESTQIMVAAMSDNDLLAKECHLILAAIAGCRENAAEIERIVQAKLAGLNDAQKKLR